MTLPTEIRAAHERGEIARMPYARKMREAHAVLANYAELIRDTEIGAIQVTDGKVVMVTRAEGVRIECDPGDMGIPPVVALNFRSYEPRDAALLLSLVEDSMTFFDVGANLGWYGLHVARRHPRARVLAFEPVPKTFGYLQRNIGHNGLANMRAFPWGLSNRSGEEVFHVNPQIMGAASSAGPTWEEDAAQPCQVRRLDEVCAELGTDPDFMKMDVEGAELLVIEGGSETIRRARPIIFAEMLRKHAARFNYHPNAIIDRLAREGYRCFTGRDDKAVEFLRMNEETTETNFVFLHGEKHAAAITRILG